MELCECLFTCVCAVVVYERTAPQSAGAVQALMVRDKFRSLSFGLEGNFSAGVSGAEVRRG